MMTLKLTWSFLTFLFAILFIEYAPADSVLASKVTDFLKHSLDEETPIGTFILSVATEAHLQSQFTPDQINQLRYTMLKTLNGRFFRLHPTRGTLTTIERLDREKLCADPKIVDCCNSRARDPDLCILQAQILVEKGDFLHSIGLAVTLNDINDNTPKFDPRQETIYIREDAPRGSLQHFTVADPDSKSLSIRFVDINYLSDDSSSRQTNLFSVRQARDGLDLVLQGALDREKVDIYRMTLVAVDGGKPSRTGTLSLTVSIVDVNDNAPEWVTRNFTVIISEATPSKSTIFTLKAKDADSENNGRIQYEIDPQDSQYTTNGEQFYIDAKTGQIQLRKRLDYSKQSRIELPVIARDSGISKRNSVRATVTIYVTDINDNPPVINVLALTMDNKFSVWENRPPGQPVSTIFVTDPDTGPGGRVTCIMENSEFELERMESGLNQGYKIFSRQTFDRETKSAYIVTIVCHDDGQPRMESRKNIQIEIKDVNDNPPVFDRKIFEINIKENNLVGQFISQINASDLDAGNNSRITYWLSDQASTYVGIHAESGKLFAKTVFDREFTPSHKFLVYAKDSGIPQETASTEVRLEILDDNDHPPFFTTNIYFFSVPESSLRGTLVGTVLASDKDLGQNSIVHYRFARPRSDDASKFRLDAKTGQIEVRSATLDRETRASYELTVLAEDSGYPRRQSQSVVHINIEDVNDHPPRFIFPSAENNYVNVSCSELSNHEVTRVHANDSDTGMNAKIEYSIVSVGPRSPIGGDGSRNPLLPLVSSGGASTGETDQDPGNQYYASAGSNDQFDINIHGGQIMLLRPFRDCRGGAPYEQILLIKANDQGQPVLSATATLTVRVLDQQPDSTPGFSGRLVGSHWTAIVGLIVATVILAILFCSILMLMRKRVMYSEEEDKRCQQGIRHVHGGSRHSNKDRSQNLDLSPDNEDHPPASQKFFYATYDPGLYDAMDIHAGAYDEKRKHDRSYQTLNHPNLTSNIGITPTPTSLAGIRSHHGNDHTYADYNQADDLLGKYGGVGGSFFDDNNSESKVTDRQHTSDHGSECGSARHKHFLMTESFRRPSYPTWQKGQTMRPKQSSPLSLSEMTTSGYPISDGGGDILEPSSMTSSGFTAVTTATLPLNKKVKNPYCTVSFV